MKNPATVALPVAPPPSLWRLFLGFFMMGATSLGGGVIAYLRTGLVTHYRWLDDKTFVELMAISQSLPGLNATNMSILAGDRLRGWPGALLGALGMCLPGASLMTAAAFAVGVGGDDPVSKAFLHAIAAGAVGLVTVVGVQLGAKMLYEIADYVFVAITIVLVAFLHVQVIYALVGVGAVAIWWHRPRKTEPHDVKKPAPEDPVS
ncbi:MAG: chromate transporter [Rhodospirillales bacterium]|nr:chromate transporter [Rhodospirillales bacterium]